MRPASAQPWGQYTENKARVCGAAGCPSGDAVHGLVGGVGTAGPGRTDGGTCLSMSQFVAQLRGFASASWT